MLGVLLFARVKPDWEAERSLPLSDFIDDIRLQFGVLQLCFTPGHIEGGPEPFDLSLGLGGQQADGGCLGRSFLWGIAFRLVSRAGLTRGTGRAFGGFGVVREIGGAS